MPTLDALKEAGFTYSNWPDDLPEPGDSNISKLEHDGTQELYRFETDVDGVDYAMEILVDTFSAENPNEGVSFMLEQFAYLWRTDRDQLAYDTEDDIPRRQF
ncbi:MAG: hypothetical protein ABEL76_11970 [Bradymonadaceae bacterium]